MKPSTLRPLNDWFAPGTFCKPPLLCTTPRSVQGRADRVEARRGAARALMQIFNAGRLSEWPIDKKQNDLGHWLSTAMDPRAVDNYESYPPVCYEGGFSDNVVTALVARVMWVAGQRARTLDAAIPNPFAPSIIDPDVPMVPPPKRKRRPRDQ